MGWVVVIKVSRVSPWLAAAGLCCAALTANATPVTLIGDTVNYVYDDSQAALALFGQPAIVGDTVRFVPFSFRSQSLNGVGLVRSEAEFVFSSVYSQDGTGLGEIGVLELGDYEILQGGSVAADLLLTVADNNSSESASVGDSLSDSGHSGSIQRWDLSAMLDAESVFSFATNNISVTLRNIVDATTDISGELAWIQKKVAFAAVGIGSGSAPNPPTEVVPVPGVLWLYGLGLLAMAAVRRRRE